LEADVARPPEPPRRGLWARLRRPRAVAPPASPMADDEALTALTGVLDALGRAHHRPFSRV
jgi:hypothetical protein